MAYMLDTSVAIKLRDGDPHARQKMGQVQGVLLMSIVTRVELEGGVYREPHLAGVKRARLQSMLGAFTTAAFDDLAADAYASIVAQLGYSRAKVLDRMIAAQAIVHRATLVTYDRTGFKGIAGLQLEVW